MSILSIPSMDDKGRPSDVEENMDGELDFSERRSVRPFANSSKNGFGKSFLWTWSV